MRDAYQCYDCKKVTIDPDCHIEYEPYEFWGERGTQAFEVYVCLHCGSEELEEYEEPELELDDELAT